MKIVLSFILINVFISCSSTTIIQTNDSEVEIFVNDKLKGKGSAVHTDMKMAWLSSKVTFKKNGCSDEFASIKKNGQLDAQSLITGIFLYVPLLWIMKYDAVHKFNFECKN